MNPFYAFFSVKGGVGKTALATTAAVALSRQGRVVALLDGDMTGTSIADGLALRAPELVSEDSIAWQGPQRGFLERSETLRRRRLHGQTEQVATLPFLDMLIDERPTFDARAVAWMHDDAPDVRWYPSSPSPMDTARTAKLLFQDARFGRRLAPVVRQIAEALGDNGAMIVDLPPGFFGIPTVFAGIEAVTLEPLTPILVSTDDRNDLYRSVEEFVRLKYAFPRARWILNRSRRAPDDVRRDLREYLSNQWPGVETELRDLGWSAELERIFKQDRLSLSAPLAERLVTLMERR